MKESPPLFVYPPQCFQRPQISAFSKLHICLYGFPCHGIVVSYLILRSVLDGWCTAFGCLFSSASATLHLSSKDSLRKVKVQKGLMPTGNNLLPPCAQVCSHPTAGSGLRPKGSISLLAGWRADRRFAHVAVTIPECFPRDSLISGAIATCLGCAHDELKFLSRLSSKYLLPLSGSEEIFFLKICQPIESWPK